MVQKKDNLPVNTDPVVTDGGTISYANEVIAIISGIAASEIEGIAGMVTTGGLGEIISKNRNITRGVKVEVGTEEVSVDLYTIVEYGQPIQKVASEVQENVRKSIESMTGLKVVRVDIHVQGVSFEKDKKDTQNRIEAAQIQHISDAAQEKKSRKAEKEAKEQEEKAAAEAEKEAEKAAEQAKAEPQEPVKEEEAAPTEEKQPEEKPEAQKQDEKAPEKAEKEAAKPAPAAPKKQPPASRRKKA